MLLKKFVTISSGTSYKKMEGRNKMGVQVLFIIFFIMIWYLALIVETYSYLKKNKLGVNFIGIISIPFSLFTLHLKMFHKRKKFIKKNLDI